MKTRTHRKYRLWRSRYETDDKKPPSSSSRNTTTKNRWRFDGWFVLSLVLLAWELLIFVWVAFLQSTNIIPSLSASTEIGVATVAVIIYIGMTILSLSMGDFFAEYPRIKSSFLLSLGRALIWFFMTVAWIAINGIDGSRSLEDCQSPSITPECLGGIVAHQAVIGVLLPASFATTFLLASGIMSTFLGT